MRKGRLHNRTAIKCWLLLSPCALAAAKPVSPLIGAGAEVSNASAAPAASFKRPYQNCPDREPGNSQLYAWGRPDRVLTCRRTDFR